jgi:YVTN family beta-propeller protein
LNEDGSSAGTVERSKPSKALLAANRLAANRPSRKLGIDDYPAVTLPLSDSKAAIITSNGDMLDFDRANMIMTFSRNLDAARNRDPMSSTWLSDRWIRPQPIHYSPGDQLVYFGSGKVSYMREGKSSLFDQVEVINSKTMTHVRSVVPPRPFFSLALSEDGKIIYTVSPDDATVTLIDSSTSAELKVIKNVGVSPIQAIVSR